MSLGIKKSNCEVYTAVDPDRKINHGRFISKKMRTTKGFKGSRIRVKYIDNKSQSLEPFLQLYGKRTLHYCVNYKPLETL
jgi:hypothetical protein